MCYYSMRYCVYLYICVYLSMKWLTVVVFIYNKLLWIENDVFIIETTYQAWIGNSQVNSVSLLWLVVTFDRLLRV